MSKPPTLTDAAGTGGGVAQDGFDYQLWYGVVRTGAWLADPAFEGVMFEALEDIEARFFAPQSDARHLLERIQAKIAELTPADVRVVLDNFLRFEAAYPRKTRTFTLATPSLPRTLRFLQRDLRRVRLAGPFYAPLREIKDASDRKVLADLTDELGEPRARLLFERGDVDVRALAAAEEAAAAFAANLTEAFGLDVGHGRLRRAFEAVVALGRARRGQKIDRDELLLAIEAELDLSLAAPGSFALHLVSDRPEPTPAGAFTLDFSAYSGVPGRYAPPADWTRDVGVPLGLLATWLRDRGRRRVAITGSYRLTTGFLLGAALRSAAGFELDIDTKSGVWATDEHPRAGDAPPLTLRPAAQLSSGVLRLAFGVLRSPEAILVGSGIPGDTIATAQCDEAVTSGRAQQALVAAFKRFATAETTRLKPEAVELYFVGPASLAVALGHRWNAMPPTQVFEFDGSANLYSPTGRVER